MTVVGGGLIGLSTAFHLARLGAGRVRLFEAGALGAQASSRSGALVRCHYTNVDEARVASAAVPWWENWADWVGGDCGFTQTGFLQFVDAADHDILRSNTAALAQAGVETEIVTGEAIRSAYPYLEVADHKIAAYEPRSGYADPARTLASLAAACRRLGVMIHEREPVQELLTGRGGMITGVRTIPARYEADAVVVANGAWSVPLLRPLGVAADITPLRVQLAFLARPTNLDRGPAGHVTIIDRRNGFYLRPSGEDATLVGLSVHQQDMGELIDPAEPQQLGPGDGEGFADLVRRAAGNRIRGYIKAARVGGHAGPLDVTPDHRMIVSDVSDVGGLYVAIGMSGGGFKKAPAVGAALAELIVDGEPTTVPLTPFALDRFRSGQLLSGAEYSLPDHDLDPTRRSSRDVHPLIH